MDKINIWLKSNRLSLNISKTKTMLFGSSQKLSRNQIPLNIFINNLPLEQTPCIKYLCVHIDPQLKWSEHINNIISSVSKRLGILNKFRLKQFLPLDILNLLVKSLIFFQFDYCDLIWNTSSKTHLDSLDKLLNRIGRVILKVPQRTHTSDVYETLGWDKLSVRRNKHLNTMVFKCITGLAPSYLNVFNKISDNYNHCTRANTDGNVILLFPRTEAGRKKLLDLGGARHGMLFLQLLKVCLLAASVVLNF